MDRPLNPAYATLLADLRRARRLLLLRDAERAGLAVLVGLISLGAVALVVALVAPLYRSEYGTLRVVLLGAAAGLFALALVRIARSRSSLAAAALEAGGLSGRPDDGLLAALELGRELARGGSEANDPRYSAELREAAVRAAAERAGSLPLGRLRRWEGRGRWLAGAGLALAGLALIGAVGGSKTPRVVRHVVNPSTAPLLPVRIRVEPGDVEVEGGASVPVRVFVVGTSAKPKLELREEAGAAAGSWRATDLAPAEETADARRGERAYATVLSNVKEDLAYRVEVADRRSAPHQITVRDLPRAVGYRVRYDYPTYTGLPSEESRAITGDLAAPRGSKASVVLLLNRSVNGARVSWEGSDRALPGEPGDRNVRFQVPVRSDGRYRLHLVDARGRRADLGPFEVRAIPDRPPTVAVLAPGTEEDLPRDLTATLIAGATDDYGVKKVLLRYRVREEPERVETLHEERSTARELGVRYTWSLQSYNLLPGETVEYAVGAVDGNAVDGPQTTWSDRRSLRFPSAAEILASVERQHDETIATLEDALRGARELHKKSEELARDMARSRDVPWEKQQEIQKTLEGQQALRELVDKTVEKLSQDADKLGESRALNAEVVQKLNELHQLLSQLRDQSILQSMRRLEEALRKLAPQDLERALQNFKLSQEDVLRKIERTIEMLKQIQTEEKLETASERAAEMERRQLALNDSLGRVAEREEMRTLAPEERAISQMSEEQRAALDSLAAALRPMDPQAAREAAEQRDALGPRGTRPLFDEAMQSLQQCEGGDAESSTGRLARELEEARKAVDQMREGFHKRRKAQLGKEMETVARGVLEVAGEQEKMIADEVTPSTERAERQQGLEESTEAAARRVVALGNLTLFVSPDIAGALGRAMQNQKSAVGRYALQDVLGGLVQSKEATFALNQAAAGLLRAVEGMSASSSSSGFKEAMESLQNLAGQQQGLNDQSLGLSQEIGGQGRLTPDQQGALGRMAAEQEAIRRGLEEAMQKMGERPGTLGRLGDVGNEMRQVEEELRSGRLERPTLDRQQRILSRLLDAPRSVEKRDYSRRRTSRPGVDVVRASPGALSPELLKARPSLAALLARGGRDPIAPRYRAMVDEYFQAILEGKAR